MIVSDLMTRRVVTVSAGERASVAGRLMWESDCGAVPVVDDHGRGVGMITDRDICMATVLQDRPPSAIAISQVMSRTLHACAPDDSLSAAEELMRAHQIRRLPVLDGERRPIGILSLADVTRATAVDKHRKKEVPPDEITATLAEICTPRAKPALGADA
jgi:CBS domain-containing protein